MVALRFCSQFLPSHEGVDLEAGEFIRSERARCLANRLKRGTTQRRLSSYGPLFSEVIARSDVPPTRCRWAGENGFSDSLQKEADVTHHVTQFWREIRIF